MKLLLKTQKKCRLKVGDTVIVTTGKAKGDQGKIERIDRKGDRVYITNVNVTKRHTKPSMGQPNGGIIDKVQPLNISKVAYLDPKEKKATRIGYRTENGKKVRFAKLSGTTL